MDPLLSDPSRATGQPLDADDRLAALLGRTVT